MIRAMGEEGKKALLLFFLGFILSFFSLGEVLFIIPLLLIRKYIGRAYSALSIAVVLLSLCIRRFIGSADSSLSIALTIFNLYIPCTLSASGIIWLYTEGWRGGRRLLLSVLPAAVFLTSFSLYMASDTALLESFLGVYRIAFEGMLSLVLDTGALTEEFWTFFMEVLVLFVLGFFVPLILFFVCVDVFLYEYISHSKEDGFEKRVASAELDSAMIWVFIISLALLLLGRLISMSWVMTIVLFNCTVILAMLYSVIGFSVLFYQIRKRSIRMRSISFFLLIALLTIVVPGINIITISVLPLIGMIENFFELRR